MAKLKFGDKASIRWREEQVLRAALPKLVEETEDLECEICEAHGGCVYRLIPSELRAGDGVVVLRCSCCDNEQDVRICDIDGGEELLASAEESR